MAQVKANHELITDNLMDADHTQYVLQDLLGTAAFERSKHDVLQEGSAVHSNYLIPESEVPEAYKAYFPADPARRVDFSVNFRWLPPALVRNSVSLIPVGKSTGEGIQRTGCHLMTPETATTTHHFFSHTRNFSLDDEKVDERIRWWQKAGLSDQDGTMIEAVQGVMGTAELDTLKPVLLSIDVAAVRVRRVLDQLIEAQVRTITISHRAGRNPSRAVSAAHFNVRVHAVSDEAPDIRTFRLKPLDGAPLPPFTPGSHIGVRMAPGLVRQYSLCNGPSEREYYQIAVKRETASRGGSRHLQEQVNTGDVLEISASKNNFRLDDSQAPCLLVAGGIGITPLLSMAKHLLATSREFELPYFSRSVAHTAFHGPLSAPIFGRRVDFHYALEADAVRAFLRRRLWQRTGDTQLYLCGPRPFMDLVEQTAAATWPPDSVHVEYFGADPQASARPRANVVVRLARSNMACEVAADQTVVDALAARGVSVESSCEQGVCGTCLTGVLSGTPDHRDVLLTDDEKQVGDKFCPCVSRSHSAEVLLDL